MTEAVGVFVGLLYLVKLVATFSSSIIAEAYIATTIRLHKII